MPRNPIDIQHTTCSGGLGTNTPGNLPQYLVNDNVCFVDLSLITYPGVRKSDFRFYHQKCPYSTQAGLHLVRDIDYNSPTYFELKALQPSDIADHNVTFGIMIRESRGSKYGWLCVDDNCPYYVNTGQRYFRI